MNRRGFLKAAIGGAALVAMPTSASASRGTKSGLYATAARTWRSEEEKYMRFWLSVTVHAFNTNEHAKNQLYDILSDPIEWLESTEGYRWDRLALDSETIRVGDDSVTFFIGVTTLNQEGFCLIARKENLLYQINVASDWDDVTRGSHSLIRDLIDRAEPDVLMGMEEIIALLPTEEEVRPYGLTDLHREYYNSFNS